VNIEIPLRANGDIKVLPNDARARLYQAVYGLLKTGKLSSTSAKSFITNLLKDGHVPTDFEKYAEEQGFIQVSDEAEIAKIVQEVIKENPQAAQDVKSGEAKAIGFLVGQVMKKSLGKANPQLAQELIQRQLQA
jgi:aspartyl-tRNA(Asn)/glutamyl-tRNA(Gln) amidotransferase subunit B